MKYMKSGLLSVLAVSSLTTVVWGLNGGMVMNHVPTANKASVKAKQGMKTYIRLSGTDEDGDSLTYALAMRPKHGVLKGIAPNLTYVADSDYVGEDGFLFRVNDGKASSTAAKITITVRASSTEEQKGNQNEIRTQQGVPVQINLDAASSGKEKNTGYVIQGRPKHGRIVGIAPNVTYLPSKGYVGKDSFMFGGVNTEGKIISINRVTIIVAEK